MMMNKQVKQALLHAKDTRAVFFASGALTQVGETFAATFPGAKAQIIADENTEAVAGEVARKSLSKAGIDLCEGLCFPAHPTLYAGYERVSEIVEVLARTPAVPIVIGSGTLNDLVKRAAFELERPYMVIATAASMDGYTAYGASLAKDGHKQTLPCPAPLAVVADVAVLAEAPSAMTASGYADLLGKVTAGADWLVADALGVELIDNRSWSLVQEPLRISIGQPEALARGDLKTIELLVEGLLMSGVAMQVHASSRPASGSEHQFSHLWEMEGLGRNLVPPLSHGFKVGIGSIAVAALYEELFESDLCAVDVDACCRAWPSFADLEDRARQAHPLLGDIAVAQLSGKYVSGEGLAARLNRLVEVWPKLRERLLDQLLPAIKLRDMLKVAGCPTTPEEIGLTREELKASYSRAQMIRSRYTVLDVAVETGLLDSCVEKLFAPGGYWASDS
ncbi:glycerol-1-phosphate dehydrogenase [NAD(P)+] [Alkalispirochaeta americana]|uniref:Glycerol-1-phosphate dehydrogenase [NAD(P)+] n=1 Tax=Alkalispirochaeta americana TaxID=159291 RepID=A0A1N6USD4_9SPIO|nr:sn-glycerol-1-phosphate dehydrogenase [Alkalispirochaeta americana]SIQ68545.1 glycerol-1-phosphate dehydrogenase [NAD(P)+] [Alkalispirochaeta americana]